MFRRLRESDVPTFAFVNGVALGGGLEVGLHCHYRTYADNVGASACPRPCWGLFRLGRNPVAAQPDRAVERRHRRDRDPLNNGKVINSKKALELGIADVVLGSADFIEQSLAWAAKVIAGDVNPARPEIDRGAGWDEAIARAKAIVEGKTKNNARRRGAHRRAARAGQHHRPLRPEVVDAGFAAEDDALADLLMTDELRAGLYAFDLVNRRAKRPAGAPDKSLARKISGVGIVGAA